MSQWEMLVAGIALLAGLWGQAKRAITWIEGLIVVTVMLDSYLAYAVASQLERTSNRQSKSRQRLISGSRAWVKPLNRFTGIAYERLIGSTRTFWRGRWPVWYAEIAKPINDLHPHAFSFFRGTIDWDALVSQAAMSPDFPLVGRQRYGVSYHFGASMALALAEQKAAEVLGSVAKHNGTAAEWTSSSRPLRWKREDLGKDPLPTGLAGLSLTMELRTIASEMGRWRGLEDWYAVRGISWRRGYLFEGAPGTGKTAFARAVAEDLDLPVHVFDLGSMSNKELRESWARMALNAPCMVILEDLDGVFHGRVNVSPQGAMSSGGLTFDALLNCVDGMERVNGVLLIVTTNHPDLVDPALADRPGRIDRVVKFEPLDLEGRLKLARRIIVDEARSVQIAVDSGPVSASRFVEMCCRVALGDVYGSDPYRTSTQAE